MKRTTLSRGKPLARGSRLTRSTRLRPIGKRGRESALELAGVRVAVLLRARGRCERCGKRAKLDLHHRLPRSRGGTHKPENLAALCTTHGNREGCHDLVTDHRVADWRDWIVTRRGGGA